MTEEALKSLRLTASSGQEEEAAAAPPPPKATVVDDGDGDMEMDTEMDTEMDEGDDDVAPPPSAPDLDAPINVVKDYQKPGSVPTTGNDAVKFMISPITGQQIPVDQVESRSPATS
jgi:hypothetical protein